MSALRKEEVTEIGFLLGDIQEAMKYFSWVI